MRVLHLTSGNMYGGIERLLGTMAEYRHLAPDMDPAFALCFRGRMWDELAATGAPLHDLGPVRVSRPWTVLRARSRLRRVLAEDRPGAVVTHGCWPHAIFAPVARRAGVRVLFLAHAHLTNDHWVERWAGRTPPDAVVANSRFTAAGVPAVFPGVRAEVVHTPVPPPAVGDPAVVRAEVRA